jgi:hypothetical protein
MTLKPLALFVLLAGSLAGAGLAADDPPAQLPKAPEGWKYLSGKDGSYHFLFPADPKRSGSREQTSKRSGLTSRSEINTCEAKDDTAFRVAATTLSGPAGRPSRG